MSPRDECEAAAGMLAAQIRLLKNATVGFIRYKQVVFMMKVLRAPILSAVILLLCVCFGVILMFCTN